MEGSFHGLAIHYNASLFPPAPFDFAGGSVTGGRPPPHYCYFTVSKAVLVNCVVPLV